MNWHKFNQLTPEQPHQLWSDSVSILINDKNLKPDWISIPVQYSEFHIKRNKDSLLIVVGESWAYGESLKGIASALQRYNLVSQLSSCFGARMALMMDVDYYQYAVPGNCNFYMFQELPRILNHVSAMGYKQVYICMQMTEPGREHAIANKLEDTPLHDVYTNFPPGITFKQWLQQYDDAFFKWFDNIIAEFKEKINIKDAMLWKNFCSTNTNIRYDSFNVIEQSWIQYSARTMGIKLDMPQIYAVGWLASMQEQYNKQMLFDTNFLMNQLDIIEKSNNFLKGNPYHHPHPNEIAHMLWAQYLTKQAGWINGL
jgi:hypothetical protein